MGRNETQKLNPLLLSFDHESEVFNKGIVGGRRPRTQGFNVRRRVSDRMKVQGMGVSSLMG